MEDIDDRIANKVQALSDLELAALICLVAEQHCIIEAEEGLLYDVGKEIKLVREITLTNWNTLLMFVDSERCLRVDVGIVGMF